MRIYSENAKAARARYDVSPARKAARARYDASRKKRETLAKWKASPAGQASLARYDASLKRQVARAKYLASPKGRAKQARASRERQGIALANYKACATALPRSFCYSCGRPAQEVDHVLPVALAWIFGLAEVVDEYVSPICVDCHKSKTRQDQADIRRNRREFERRLTSAPDR